MVNHARRALRAARRWLENESPSQKAVDAQARDFENHDSLYPWLGAMFERITAEGGAEKPAYAWGVLNGGQLAKALGISRTSVIEFGVAGGRGLLALEKIAKAVERILDIGVDVYGFDTGMGLPKPNDYRDLPNLYAEGHFAMDAEMLKTRLERAQLMLGLVQDTVPKFVMSSPAPISFVSIDLDLYSSTVHALQLFEAEQRLLLPRVQCYFDDITGYTFAEYTGERLAMAEFNASHQMRKISPVYGLRYYLPRAHANALWPEKMYLAHLFDHNLYGKYDGLSRHDRVRSTDLDYGG